MLAMKDRLPSFPQLIESLRRPEEQAAPPPPTTWRNPPSVIDDDTMSDTRSRSSSRSNSHSSPPLPPVGGGAQQQQQQQRGDRGSAVRSSRSPQARVPSAEASAVRQNRYAPYQTHGRGPSVPSLNVDKANHKAVEKPQPTPPISLSLRRANRPQPLALAPKSQNADIAPAPISALLRSHAQTHSNSPRISGHPHTAPPRSPMHPMTPVSIPTLPLNLPISPMTAQFSQQAMQQQQQQQREAALMTEPGGSGGKAEGGN